MSSSKKTIKQPVLRFGEKPVFKKYDDRMDYNTAYNPAYWRRTNASLSHARGFIERAIQPGFLRWVVNNRAKKRRENIEKSILDYYNRAAFAKKAKWVVPLATMSPAREHQERWRIRNPQHAKKVVRGIGYDSQGKPKYHLAPKVYNPGYQY